MILFPHHKSFILAVAIHAIILSFSLGSFSKSAATPQEIPSVKIKTLRFGTHARFSRLVVDLEKKIPYQSEPNKDTRQLVVVFQPAEGSEKRDWGFKDERINRIESTMEKETRNWRVSIMYSQDAIAWRGFYLDDPPRWVFDFSRQKQPGKEGAVKKALERKEPLSQSAKIETQDESTLTEATPSSEGPRELPEISLANNEEKEILTEENHPTNASNNLMAEEFPFPGQETRHYPAGRIGSPDPILNLMAEEFPFLPAPHPSNRATEDAPTIKGEGDLSLSPTGEGKFRVRPVLDTGMVDNLTAQEFPFSGSGDPALPQGRIGSPDPILNLTALAPPKRGDSESRKEDTDSKNEGKESRNSDEVLQLAMFNQAKSLEKQGNPLDAGVIYKRLLDSSPKRELALKAHLSLGDIHYSFNDWADALIEYQLAHNGASGLEDSELKRVSFRIAELLLMSANTMAEGTTFYLRSLGKWPDYTDLSPQTIYNLAEIFHQRGDYSKARELLLFLVNVYSKNAAVPLFLQKIGDSYVKQGLTDSAEKSYEEIIRRYPNHAISALGKLRLGEIAYEYKSVSRDPLKLFQEVSEIDPYSPLAEMALRKKGIILAAENKYLQAHETFKELMLRFPNSVSSEETQLILANNFQNLINTLREGKNDYDVLALFDENQELWSYLKNEAFFSTLIESSMELGNYDYAEKILSKLSRETGLKWDWVYLKLAEIALKKHAYDAVNAILKSFIENYPGSKLLSRAYFIWAEAFFLQEKYGEAAFHYQRSIALGQAGPSRAMLFYRLGFSFSALKNWSTGAEAFQNATREVKGKAKEEEFPYLVETYLALANSLVAQGKKDQARRVLQEIHQLFPLDEMASPLTHRLGVLEKEAGAINEAKQVFHRLSERRNKGFWTRAAVLELEKIDWEERIGKDVNMLYSRLGESR